MIIQQRQKAWVESTVGAWYCKFQCMIENVVVEDIILTLVSSFLLFYYSGSNLMNFFMCCVDSISDFRVVDINFPFFTVSFALECSGNS